MEGIHKMSVRLDRETELLIDRCIEASGLKLGAMMSKIIDNYLSQERKEEQPEDDKEPDTTMYCIRISSAQHAELMARRKLDDVSVTEIVRRAVHAWADAHLHEEYTALDAVWGSKWQAACLYLEDVAPERLSAALAEYDAMRTTDKPDARTDALVSRHPDTPSGRQVLVEHLGGKLGDIAAEEYLRRLPRETAQEIARSLSHAGGCVQVVPGVVLRGGPSLARMWSAVHKDEEPISGRPESTDARPS